MNHTKSLRPSTLAIDVSLLRRELLLSRQLQKNRSIRREMEISMINRISGNTPNIPISYFLEKMPEIMLLESLDTLSKIELTKDSNLT